MYGIEFTPFFVAPTFVCTGHKWVKFFLLNFEKNEWFDSFVTDSTLTKITKK